MTLDREDVSRVLIKYVGMDKVVMKYGYTADKELIYCRYIRSLSMGHLGSVKNFAPARRLSTQHLHLSTLYLLKIHTSLINYRISIVKQEFALDKVKTNDGYPLFTHALSKHYIAEKFVDNVKSKYRYPKFIQALSKLFITQKFVWIN